MGIRSFIECKIGWAEKFGQPLVLLAARLYVANIFLKSGMLKFQNYLDGNWENTVFLFEEEHPVPYLSPDIAAVLGTGGELLLPILLIFGAGTRFAALGLLFMTAIIEFTYRHFEIHEFWALLLAVSLVFGAGKISIDYFIKRKFS